MFYPDRKKKAFVSIGDVPHRFLSGAAVVDDPACDDRLHLRDGSLLSGVYLIYGRKDLEKDPLVCAKCHYTDRIPFLLFSVSSDPGRNHGLPAVSGLSLPGQGEDSIR